MRLTASPPMPADISYSAAPSFDVSLPATSHAPARARHVLEPQLRSWSTTRCGAALLVLSELVTNAVRHGSDGERDCVRVRTTRRGPTLRIEVVDGAAFGPARLPSPEAHVDGDGDARSGWGLPIVAELCDRWGVEHLPARTCVWCELDA